MKRRELVAIVAAILHSGSRTTEQSVIDAVTSARAIVDEAQEQAKSWT